MPYKSLAQARFMESKASPLSQSQKEEWRGSTDWSSLPKKLPSSRTRKRLSEKLAAQRRKI